MLNITGDFCFFFFLLNYLPMALENFVPTIESFVEKSGIEQKRFLFQLISVIQYDQFVIARSKVKENK